MDATKNPLNFCFLPGKLAGERRACKRACQAKETAPHCLTSRQGLIVPKSNSRTSWECFSPVTGAHRFQRRVVHYTGHVQGVGFRYTTLAIAKRYRVAGYVRNLSDGGVELLAEGDASELDKFLAEVEQSLGQFVRDCHVEKGVATGEFAGFAIRH